MQTENRLLDDLARMANGALNTLSGVREEIESRVRERVERMLADMDMVPREEFEAVQGDGPDRAQRAGGPRGAGRRARAPAERAVGERSAATAKAASGRSATARPATPKKPKPAVTRSRPAGPKTAAKPTSE